MYHMHYYMMEAMYLLKYAMKANAYYVIYYYRRAMLYYMIYNMEQGRAI